MANIDEAIKVMAENIAELKEVAKAQNEDKAAKAEEALKEKAVLDKALVEDTDNKMEKGKTYTILDAKKDYESGKREPFPTWTDDAMEAFGKFIIASKTKDSQTIREVSKEYSAKASGPYTETTTAGGYLLPTGFIPELVRLQYVRSVALQKARVIPLPAGGGATFNLPSLTTQASALWGGINTQIGDTVNVFGQLALTPEKAVGLSNCPNELLRDSPMNVAQIITEEWTEAFAKLIDTEYFTGDTSDTSNHKFNGWEFATGVHESTAGDSGDSVYGSLTLAQLVDAMSQLTSVELEGAEWFMHPSTWAYIRGLTGGDTGNDHPFVAINGPKMYDIMGYPVTLSDQATAAVGSIAAGRAAVYFGNPRLIYVGMMNDIVVDSSDSFRFDYDQTTFRAIQRIAINTVQGGSLAMITRSAADGS